MPVVSSTAPQKVRDFQPLEKEASKERIFSEFLNVMSFFLGSFSGWVFDGYVFFRAGVRLFHSGSPVIFSSITFCGKETTPKTWICASFSGGDEHHRLTYICPYINKRLTRKEGGGSRVRVPLVYTGVCFETSFKSIFLADDLCHNLLKLRSF